MQNIKVIEEYKPCLRTFPRHLFSIVLSDARKNSKRVCSTIENRIEAVENLKCVTNETFGQAAQVAHDITTFIKYVAKLNDTEEVIPSLCCGYHRLYEDAKNVVDKMCNDQGVGEKGTKYILDLAF